MKLRLRDNSLRIRITRSEVQRLFELGSIKSSTALGPRPENCLIYCLESCSFADSIRVSFEGNLIRIVLPESRARAWFFGPEVGIYAEQSMNTETLKILVEKDFFCLKPRTHEQENEAVMFPNPNASTGRCG